MKLYAIHQIVRGSKAKPPIAMPGALFDGTAAEAKQLLDMGAAREPTDEELKLLQSDDSKAEAAKKAAEEKAAAEAEAAKKAAEEKAAAEAEAAKKAAEEKAAADAEAAKKAGGKKPGASEQLV